jgi:hypothetical protein
VLGLFALLPACAVDMADPESEDIASENTELVQEAPGAPEPEPEATSPSGSQFTSPVTAGPSGPTPDPWNESGPGGPTPDPWVNPVESTKKKTAH